QFLCAGGQLIDFATEVKPSDRSILAVAGGASEHLEEPLSAWQPDLIHFFEVMIFCREPKHRNALDAEFSRLGDEFDCAKGLVERKHWATEKANLLPGDHG